MKKYLSNPHRYRLRRHNIGCRAEPRERASDRPGPGHEHDCVAGPEAV